MRDQITAVLRTVVPSLWGSALGFLLQHNVISPGQALDAAPVGLQLAELVAIPTAIGLYYVTVRWLESRTWMPRWIVRLLIGSAQTPSYPTHTRTARNPTFE